MGCFISVSTLQHLPEDCLHKRAAKLMPVGRSVLVKVLTVDPEQGQATLTMNEKDLRLSVAECDLMYKCLYEQLMSINKYVTGALSPEDALSGLRVGQVVEATVTKITKNNVRLTVGDSEIKATAPGTLATGNYPYIICFIYCIRLVITITMYLCHRLQAIP